MREVEGGQLKAVFSSIVFGEVLRMPAHESLEPIKQFFARLGGSDFAADKAVCAQAAELRREYSTLRLPDAIHLATAILAKADIFITADKPLAKIAKKEIKTAYLKDFRDKV